MSHVETDAPRTDLDFGWVSDLPTYAGLMPVNNSSLLPKFSLFSLFRSARPSLPRDDQLEPLFSLGRSPNTAASPQEGSKALGALAEYVSLLKTSCAALGTGKEEEAERWVLKAMEGYLVAIAIVSRITFTETSPEARELGLTIPQSLRGLFTIHAHFVGSTRLAVSDALERITGNLLAAPHEAIGGHHEHLTPLFSQTREITRRLQHVARASHTKSTVASSSENEAGVWEERAGERMEWLRLFADHVRGLSGLKTLVKEKGRKGKKVTKKAMKAAEKEEVERPMRIALEADLVRCDLAVSMATARIGEIKRRARAQVGQGGSGGEGTKEGEEEEVEVKEEGGRKRRALTDESDLDTVPDPTDWEPVLPHPTGAQDDQGRRWEDEVEMALLETLRKVKDTLADRHAAVLVDNINRADWLPTPSSSFRHVPSPSKSAPSATRQADDSDTEPYSSSSDGDSDSSDDLSHPCPLRTLFRLHDRYEEQRLAVWLSLPHDARGKMGAYMRGMEGRVGAAWDTVGLKLLSEFDSHELEEYGLSPDKYDKWVELAARRNPKKIRKKGRKTV